MRSISSVCFASSNTDRSLRAQVIATYTEKPTHGGASIAVIFWVREEERVLSRYMSARGGINKAPAHLEVTESPISAPLATRARSGVLLPVCRSPQSATRMAYTPKHTYGLSHKAARLRVTKSPSQKSATAPIVEPTSEPVRISPIRNTAGGMSAPHIREGNRHPSGLSPNTLSERLIR